jgi:DNA-directed RNA polymerase specialized sigma24 family protein
MMDDLVKLVRTYRLTGGLAERVRLAEDIFRLIEPGLRLFVFTRVPHHTAADVFQEVLKAVATGLSKFDGGSGKQFWRWCYRIARNKLNDHYRRQHIELEHMQPMPPEEIWQLVAASAQDAPLSSADRLDLGYAMKLITASTRMLRFPLESISSLVWPTARLLKTEIRPTMPCG